jgi:hypothetical protein
MTVSILIIVGLATVLAGEIVMFIKDEPMEHALTSMDIRDIRKPEALIGLGASIIAAGLLLNLVGRKVRRRQRYKVHRRERYRESGDY